MIFRLGSDFLLKNAYILYICQFHSYIQNTIFLYSVCYVLIFKLAFVLIIYSFCFYLIAFLSLICFYSPEVAVFYLNLRIQDTKQERKRKAKRFLMGIPYFLDHFCHHLVTIQLIFILIICFYPLRRIRFV